MRGGLFEKITKSDSGVTEYRHYLQAGGTTIAVHTKWSSGSPRTEYLHQDHQGSVALITNSAGGVVDRLSYDPWGKRRHAVTNPWLGLAPANYLLPTSLLNLKRGYTGHEHLDGVGLIHMNGRVYDPETGRFLSADPIVQFPESTQGLDRYSYVLNNPLSFTDPSGHLIGLVTTAVSAVVSAATAGSSLAALAVAAVGYLQTGTLEGALFSLASAAISFGIGNFMQSAFLATWTTAQQIALAATLHGLAQGTLGAMQGGKFGAGFLAGFASSALEPKGVPKDATDRVVRVIQSAAVGGTASVIGDGKFANGALSGAFVQAFNDQLHEGANHKSKRTKSLSSEEWGLIGQVDPGLERSFDAGQEIAVEFRSDAFPPTERWYAEVSVRPLNEDGSLQSVIADPSWFEPVKYFGQTGQAGIYIGDKYIMNAGPSAPGGYRWTIRIPPQAPTHGNSSWRSIHVYERREQP